MRHIGMETPARQSVSRATHKKDFSSTLAVASATFSGARIRRRARRRAFGDGVLRAAASATNPAAEGHDERFGSSRPWRPVGGFLRRGMGVAVASSRCRRRGLATTIVWGLRVGKCGACDERWFAAFLD